MNHGFLQHKKYRLFTDLSLYQSLSLCLLELFLTVIFANFVDDVICKYQS